jgi:cytochrome c5
MRLCGKPNARRIDPLVSASLLAAVMLAAWMTPTSAEDPSAVAAGGVTLHSVRADFPDPGRIFPGTADAVNNSCLACHSTGMVLTQPRLSRAEWQAEVNKMRNVYKAPIADADVPAIVDYLANLSNGN